MAKIFGINKGEIFADVVVNTVTNPAQNIQLIVNTDVIVNKQDIADAFANLWVYLEQTDEVSA